MFIFEYSIFKDVDFVIEVVVENLKVKGIVLKEVEENVVDDVIICLNIFIIFINQLVESLDKLECFCGMYFFNLVYCMLLVEIICGEKIFEEIINVVVVVIFKMGKILIVVNDCLGFLVNCVLFLYFVGFSKLFIDGVDFVVVDKVMEKIFGWFMGFVYLMDVVGIDIGDYVVDVMVVGILECMVCLDNDLVIFFYKEECLGQKNGKGFYNYGVDKCGKLFKIFVEEVYVLMVLYVVDKKDFEVDDIIVCFMIFMVNEVICCLEEGIVDSVVEVDMVLFYGLGFFLFCGGIFCWIEIIGLVNFVVMVDKYVEFGFIYQILDGVCEMVVFGKFYFV